ncbi:hypothetical protein WMY93_020983 [Mugilogobius chulae]|uniref:Uncharacterized protein n=1 Tax=Mugilogobius chulae TaxID=88201 RepID=A0AAW0N9F8_9GOBI
MDSAKLQKSVCATTRNGPTHGPLPRLQSPLGVEQVWQVNKNDTKPSPDIEKTTLKTKLPPKMEQPKRIYHSMLLRLRDLEKASTCSEWKDSWKMVKHRIRTKWPDRRANLERIVENVKTPVRCKSKRFQPNLEHPFDLMATAKTTHEITWRLARRVEGLRNSASPRQALLRSVGGGMEKFSISERKLSKQPTKHIEQDVQSKVSDKVWCDSWKVGTVSQKCPPRNLQPEVSSEYGSKWGMSFRLANPMPKTDESWVKTSPNTCYYVVMWSNQKNNPKYYINTEFTNNSRVSKLWGGSQQFLQSFSPKSVKKGKATGQPTDPRVILVKKEKLRKQQYVNLERKDMKPEKKWAGCHLLGKTQPKPKRGGAVKTVKLQRTVGRRS